MKKFERAEHNIWDDGFGNMYADNPKNEGMPINVAYEVHRKRLDTAELAAEYWKARAEHFESLVNRMWEGAEIHPEDESIASNRAEVIARFVGNPHANKLS